MNPHTKMKVFFTVGTILIVLSVIFASCFGLIFNKVLNNALIIDQGKPIFDQFTAPTTPIYLDYYFFNVTNPDDIKNYGAKPILKEVGPYSYKEQFNKYDFEFDDPAGTVSYYQNSTYFFNEDKSNGTEQDKITTLNAVMVILGHKIDNLSPGLKAIGELLFLRFNLDDNLFITRSVSELLFKGYYDPFVDLMGQLTGDPSQSDGKFGFYLHSNGTNDGLWKVNTGAKGMDEYLYIQEWKNSSTLDYWNDTLCDMINGTDGTQFPPGVTKGEVLRLYTSELCRSVFVTFEKEKLSHETLLYRFTLPRDALAITSSTKCFCKDEFSCQDTMMDLRMCKQGAPVILSTPHFYQGDGVELAKIDGLSPSKELHETFLDVEPTSGVVMAASKRIQMNLPLRRYGNLPSFRNVPEVIFPVLWADENAIISKEDADSFQKVLTLPFIVAYSISGFLILVGLILVIYGYILYKRLKRDPKFEALKK